MNRKFVISDARLLEHAGVILKNLSDSLADFSAFDPDLNQDKITRLNELYQVALAEGGDHAERGKLGEKTQA